MDIAAALVLIGLWLLGFLLALAVRFPNVWIFVRHCDRKIKVLIQLIFLSLMFCGAGIIVGLTLSVGSYIIFVSQQWIMPKEISGLSVLFFLVCPICFTFFGTSFLIRRLISA